MTPDPTKKVYHDWQRKMLVQCPHHPEMDGAIGFACEPFKMSRYGPSWQLFYSPLVAKPSADDKDCVLVEQRYLADIPPRVAKLLERFLFVDN